MKKFTLAASISAAILITGSGAASAWTGDIELG